MLDIFAYDRTLVNDELARMRYEASIRPGFQEAFSQMFPAPGQRSVDGLASPEAGIGALSHQTLIIHGREDKVIPLANSYRLFELIAKSQLHVFGQCGHWTQIEHAARFNRLVGDFFAEAAIYSNFLQRPMSLLTSTIDQLARALWQAECGLLPIDTLSFRYPDLNETDAYEIARQKMKLRGRATVGYKLGYTSAAMRQQMNIDEPNYGVLSEDIGVAQDSGEVAFDSLIHPLVEPEMAVRLDRQLAGGGHDRQSVLLAGGVCMPALEICDTRYREYVFKAVDNIVDNSSSARYVLGAPHAISSVGDFRRIQVEFWADGKLLDQGRGSNSNGWSVDCRCLACQQTQS